jgi:hypothetical protein
MRHRMTLQNSASGKTYELVLETAGDGWRGTWRTLAAGGAPTEGPHGFHQGPDATALFEHAKRAIEDADSDVVGVDWDFSEPLPPWLAE